MKKNINKKISSLLLVIFSIFFAFNNVFAQVKKEGTTLKNPLEGVDTIYKLITNVANYLMTFVGAIAVLMIIWGGAMYMTSAGNDERVGTAKKIITGTIIGLVLAVLSYVIVRFVISAIGGKVS